MSFKFRIRPFVNAFRQELADNGYTVDILPEKLLKTYLAHQRYISRFNEDGRKAKSKGTHVWIVEAKKTADGGFVFQEFARKIVGPEPPDKATVGTRYRYEPRIFDPQLSSGSNWTGQARLERPTQSCPSLSDPRARFRSPILPYWLSWENNTSLTGIVPPDAAPVDVQVIGEYEFASDSGCYPPARVRASATYQRCFITFPAIQVIKEFHIDIVPWDAALSPLPVGAFADPHGPYSPNGTLDSRTFAAPPPYPPTPAETTTPIPTSIPTIAIDLGPKRKGGGQRTKQQDTGPAMGQHGRQQGMVQPHHHLPMPNVQQVPRRVPPVGTGYEHINPNLGFQGGVKRKYAPPPVVPQPENDFSHALYEQVFDGGSHRFGESGSYIEADLHMGEQPLGVNGYHGYGAGYEAPEPFRYPRYGGGARNALQAPQYGNEIVHYDEDDDF